MPTLQMPSRMYAAIYDKMNAGPEEAGVGAFRYELISAAKGATIEIGAGTGLNLAHYPPAVTRLVLTEPDRAMRTRLSAKIEETAVAGIELRGVSADALGCEDNSFDTAVSTTVLCTVPDPAAALAELRRVLKPGGQLLFLEHVRSERPRIARLQHIVTPLYKVMGRGCRPNRDTLAAIERAGFRIRSHRREVAPKTPPTENELVLGIAENPPE